MKLHTKDYLNFQILDDAGVCIREFHGIKSIKGVLPGDEVSEEGMLIKRATHPSIVGVLHLTSKVKYGMTSRHIPLYLFEPLNKAYPLMVVGSSEKGALKNMIAIVNFESWDPESKFPRGSLVSMIGSCGDLTSESNALLLRYSPWKYPKAYEISSKYKDALQTRPLIKGLTFNIDPPGCEDVDDVFTIEEVNICTWALTISITDVATAVEADSPLDTYSQKVGQSLYPTGSSPKHMLPPKLGTQELSLLPNKERNCISLRILWSTLTGLRVGDPEFILSRLSVDKAYTYAQAQTETRAEFKVLRSISQAIANKPLESTEEIVEALMIYYNKEAGKLLKLYKTGILRSHSAPDQERLQKWESIEPALKMLAYSSASYVPGSEPCVHWGLGLEDYAHASSPLRRYADLYNQRCLLAILEHNPVLETPSQICKKLNALQKDAKAFERDTFFLNCLNSPSATSVEGIILEINYDKQAIQVWVSTWNRIIKVKCSIDDSGSIVSRDMKKDFKVAFTQHVMVSYSINYNSAQWKERILFRIDPISADKDCLE